MVKFLSTPSGWRATGPSPRTVIGCSVFLSTPSGWRATQRSRLKFGLLNISIHALRVEGDLRQLRADRDACSISIHALRVEGDYVFEGRLDERKPHFYPRPPGGGRRLGWEDAAHTLEFLSTPSGWRATYYGLFKNECPGEISIHALRVEGDQAHKIA